MRFTNYLLKFRINLPRTKQYFQRSWKSSAQMYLFEDVIKYISQTRHATLQKGDC